MNAFQVIWSDFINWCCHIFIKSQLFYLVLVLFLLVNTSFTYIIITHYNNVQSKWFVFCFGFRVASATLAFVSIFNESDNVSLLESLIRPNVVIQYEWTNNQTDQLHCNNSLKVSKSMVSICIKVLFILQVLN